MGDYEKFKEKVYQLTKIDLSSYKERQMKRRIDSLITKNNIKSYVLYSMYKSYNLIYRNSSIIKNNWHYKEFVSCIVDYFFIIY